MRQVLDDVLHQVEHDHRHDENVKKVVMDIRRNMIVYQNKSKLNAYLHRLTVLRRLENELIDTIKNKSDDTEATKAYEELQNHFLEMYAQLESAEFKEFLIKMALLDESDIMTAYWERRNERYLVDARQNLRLINRVQHVQEDDYVRALDAFVMHHKGFVLPSATLRYWGGAKLPLHTNSLLVKDGTYYQSLGIMRDRSCDEYGHRLILKSLADDATEDDFITIPHSLERQNIRTREVYYDSDGDECTAYGGHWTWEVGCKKLNMDLSECKRYIRDKWIGAYPRGHPKVGLCKELVERGVLH